MLTFQNLHAVSVGEAMIEMAPVEGGLYRRGFAGDTFNTAWHMAQALQSVAKIGFVTKVGEDRLSNLFVSELANDGLDLSVVSKDPARTMGMYLIELSGVERSFSYWRENSAARLLAQDKVLIANAFRDVGLIHLSGITLAILDTKSRTTLFEALATARQNGAIVSFDPNIRPSLWSSKDEVRETVQQVSELTDIALPSFDDEVENWGDSSAQATIERYVASGIREVVVKNGEGTIMSFSDGEILETETSRVDGILDTSGAGDAFNAGYLAARLIGRSPALSIRSGQEMSAEILQHFGARIPRASVPMIV